MPKGIAKDPSKDRRRCGVKGGRWKHDKPAPRYSDYKAKKPNPGKRGVTSPYTLDEKRAACLEYMITGSALAVERKTGITDGTIGQWRKTDWWLEMQAELQDEYEDAIRAKMNAVIDKAFDETIDRLENGDVIYDSKRGSQVRVPVKAKDAMTIGAIGYDKRRISLNMPTSINANASSGQIENLAKQFAELSQNFKYKQIREDNALPGEYRDISEGDKKKGS